MHRAVCTAWKGGGGTYIVQSENSNGVETTRRTGALGIK